MIAQKFVMQFLKIWPCNASLARLIHTNIIILKPDITPEECRKNLKHIHTTITLHYLRYRKCNKVTNTTPQAILLSEQTLLPVRHMHKKLEQLRANKSPPMQSYLHIVNPETYTSQCPLCLSHTRDTNCLLIASLTAVNYQHSTTSL